MLGFILFVIWVLALTSTVALGCWAYFNAQLRGVKNPGVWGVIVASAPFFLGWIVYMFYRVSNGAKPVQSEVQDASDWANFEQPLQQATQQQDNEKLRLLCSRCSLVFALSFAVSIVLWCIFSYLFITGLAAVLVGSLGAISAGINDIASQIPSIGG